MGDELGSRDSVAATVMPSSLPIRYSIFGWELPFLYFTCVFLQAACWTDSRYYLQAGDQLDCNWRLMRMGEDDDYAGWLLGDANLTSGMCLHYFFIGTKNTAD